jgi:sugar phosphate isomerase/epimerase
MPRLSLSSWSLHPLLGRAWYAEDEDGMLVNASTEAARLDLLNVPAALRQHGIGTLELCHFHLPRVDDIYLRQLRGRLRDHGIELFSLLIDRGDISSADLSRREADLELARHWIDVADVLDAGHVRVIAGDEEPSEDALARSIDGLQLLASHARHRGIRVLTENFKRLAARPEACLQLLDACDGQVGFCADFGNFPEATRVEDLVAVLPRATSLHAKADDTDDGWDRTSFEALLCLAADHGFDGPASLICQEEDEGWSRIDDMRGVAASAWSLPEA